jgi:hypothetical protein
LEKVVPKKITENSQHTVQNEKYRIQNTPAAKLRYIKLPMYLFFYMVLGLIDFDGASSFCHFYSKLSFYLYMYYYCSISLLILYGYKNSLLSIIAVVDGAAMPAEPWSRPPGE